ncbi:MAG: type II secretion system F family protein [bacterium]|nr:type II secretion system F family protein [bacterium]MDA1024399.1 type II secretion system F family protein [bacterium]
MANKTLLKKILAFQITTGVKGVDLVQFLKNLSVMLSAGLTLPESLDILFDQSPKRSALRPVLERLSKRVHAGASLGDALQLEPRIFKPFIVSSIIIGEQSGTLAMNLERVFIQMERDLKIKRQVQSSMLYPGLVFTASLALFFGIANFVLPQITDVFTSLNVELPITTRALIWTANLFDRHGLLITVFTIAVLIGSVMLSRLPFARPYIDRTYLYIPGLNSFVNDYQRARFCRILSTLLESGTPIVEATKVTSDALGNVAYKQMAKRALERVKTGMTLSESLEIAPKLYPKMLRRMAAVGERSGHLGATLNYLADYYEERIEVLSKNLASMIEPVLLIALGLFVGLLALSILTPIYSITGSVTI